MDLLAPTFSGDLMDSLTHFERRATSWELETKETLFDLIKIGVVIKGLETCGFRDHLLINTAGTTEWTKKFFMKFVNETENVESARRTVPMDLSGWAVTIKSSKETVLGVEFTATWREIVERKPKTCKTTKRMTGLARTTKRKDSEQYDGLRYDPEPILTDLLSHG